eukprot:1699390-Amphidinium_carterae.1
MHVQACSLWISTRKCCNSEMMADAHLGTLSGDSPAVKVSKVFHTETQAPIQQKDKHMVRQGRFLI